MNRPPRMASVSNLEVTRTELRNDSRFAMEHLRVTGTDPKECSMPRYASTSENLEQP